MKKTSAVILRPALRTGILEQELSATFENGGSICFTVRKSSLVDCLVTLRSALIFTPLDRNLSCDLTLRFWRLDEKYEELTIESSGSCTFYGGIPTPENLISNLVGMCRKRFLKRLAKNGIILRGVKGAL